MPAWTHISTHTIIFADIYFDCPLLLLLHRLRRRQSMSLCRLSSSSIQRCSTDTSPHPVLQLWAPLALNPNRVWQSHYLLVFCCLLTVAWWRNGPLIGQVGLEASWHSEERQTFLSYHWNYNSVVTFPSEGIEGAGSGGQTLDSACFINALVTRGSNFSAELKNLRLRRRILNEHIHLNPVKIIEVLRWPCTLSVIS